MTSIKEEQKKEQSMYNIINILLWRLQAFFAGLKWNDTFIETNHNGFMLIYYCSTYWIHGLIKTSLLLFHAVLFPIYFMSQT
jgi:hypothetical protein